VQVDIAPTESVHLASGQPGKQAKHEGGAVAQRQQVVAVGGGEDSGDLGFGEPVWLPDADAADANPVAEPPGGVDVDAAGVVRPAEQRLQRGAVVARRRRRPAGSVPVPLRDERDEVVGGELADRLVGVEALDPPVGVAPRLAGGVGADRARPVGVERGDGVGPQRQRGERGIDFGHVDLLRRRDVRRGGRVRDRRSTVWLRFRRRGSWWRCGGLTPGDYHQPATWANARWRSQP
jgi:hypothetical protein